MVRTLKSRNNHQNPKSREKKEEKKAAAAEEFDAHTTWRVFKIMSEFVDAFEELKAIGPAVTMWGSARAPRDSHYYQLTQQTAKEISRAGFSVITGGGPGLMEAANRGAKEAKGKGQSIGLNIAIPQEQSANLYLDLELEFKYFFIRKIMFVKHASAFVIMPGGFGTMDELFECLTLIQTSKSPPFPVILMGKNYWTGLLSWLKSNAVKLGYLEESDLKIFHLTDDPKEVVRIIKKANHKS